VRTLAVALVALGCATTTGCWFRKKAAPAVVVNKPPAHPLILPAKPPPPTVPEPDVQIAGKTELPTLTLPQDAPRIVPPPKPRRRPAQSAAQGPPAQPEPAEPIPQLEPVLSPEERERLTAEYSIRKKRAETVLARFRTRRLSNQQLETVQRVRSFLRQAEEQFEQDLATAVQLVRRADLLAADLGGSLQ